MTEILGNLGFVMLLVVLSLLCWCAFQMTKPIKKKGDVYALSVRIPDNSPGSGCG